MSKRLTFLTFMLLMVPVFVLAQGSEAPPKPDVVQELALAIVALTPIAVRFLVYGSFLFVQRVPKWALPVLGVAVSQAAAYLSGITASDPALAALLSAGTIGLREIVDRFFTQPLSLGGKLTYSEGSFVYKR